MIYFIINANDIGWSCLIQEGIQKMFVEIDDKGRVKREIGFDSNNQIIHAYPSYPFKKYPYGAYGFFDLNIFGQCTIWQIF